MEYEHGKYSKSEGAITTVAILNTLTSENLLNFALPLVDLVPLLCLSRFKIVKIQALPRNTRNERKINQ